MILQFLMAVPIVILNGLTQWLPSVTVLPMGIDSYLVQGMGYLQFLISVFPPMGAIYNAFLFVLSFKLGIKLLAMIPFVNKILYKA